MTGRHAGLSACALAGKTGGWQNAVAIVLNDRTDPAKALPRSPGFHKALDDAGMITVLKNAARRLGYVVR